jgi:hypothetical protein
VGKRAVICIGVNRAGAMTPLRGAIKGARDFRAWAGAQGAETSLLIDRGKKRIAVSDIFDVVEACVEAGTYDQLIVYFSGHGILLAPGAEYWLLSRAPANPNEAVNLSRSIEEARNSGIPHVVFVSDACRSSVTGPPLSGVTGGVIFPSSPVRQRRSEVDVFYATRPGDPAYEVPEAEATKRYRGIFTDNLLKAIKAPKQEWIEQVDDGQTTLTVVTSRQLKPYLETIVPADAAAADVRLRQVPEVRVETALPKFFSAVDATAVSPGPEAPPPPPSAPETTEAALSAVGDRYLGIPEAPATTDRAVTEVIGITAEVERLVATRGRQSFETRTGFTVFGAQTVRADALRWDAGVFRDSSDQAAIHVRLVPREGNAARHASSVVLEFDRRIGTVLPVLPGFVGTVVVQQGRVVSVNYVPAAHTSRHRQYEQRARELEEMKAFAAVASRHGRFVVDQLSAVELAGRIRQAKGIDPTMGLYAAYAYAQVGRYEDVYSVYRYMRDDEIELPVPFDVLMLATRHKPDAHTERRARFAPFAPMLSQGWALLMEGDPMHAQAHEKVRPHLIPSLWTTLDADGVRLVRRDLRSGRIR